MLARREPGSLRPMNASQDLSAASAGAPTSDERTLGMLAHLLAIVSHFIGPLIVWLIKKDESKFVDHHGKEVLNFMITVFIAELCCIPLLFVLVGFVLLPLVGLIALVFLILASIAAYNGQYYRYPLSIRLLK